MIQMNLPVTDSDEFSSLPAINLADIIVPTVQKGTLEQTHYFFSASIPSAFSLGVNLTGAEEYCEPTWTAAKNTCSIANASFPYGQSTAQWWEYSLAPHSYLPLNDGIIQIGLNFFNRFLHLDVKARSAQLIDPGVGNDMLCTTNWFDHQSGELWFASWPAEESVRRILNPQATVRASIWKLSLQDNHLARVWQGELGDSLHQLTLSPDRRFLMLTELGMRFQEALPTESPVTIPLNWSQVRDRRLLPSAVLVLNLQTDDAWRLPLQTAGHVEFDPDEENVCYLSEHNIGLIGTDVGLVGSGSIKKILLKETGPELAGEFTHPLFQRITTHIVFRHRGKMLIGVTGYPNTVFLIDATTMTLYNTIAMEPGEHVDIERFPHICGQDSYGIAVSDDGEHLLAAGTGFIRWANIAEGRFSNDESLGAIDANDCFTGHLGLYKIS